MKIYTKTGDKGTTALFRGTRVSKNHIRIESYGTVDELNSHIGLVRDQNIDKQDYRFVGRNRTEGTADNGFERKRYKRGS